MANKKKSKQKTTKSAVQQKKTITKVPQGDETLAKDAEVKKDRKEKAEKADKPAKPSKKAASKKKKPNIFVRAIEFIKGVFTELKKVTWLSGEELVKSTSVVAGMVAILTLVIWLVDTGLGAMAAKLLGS